MGICLSHADLRNLVARISLDSVIRFSFPTYPDDFFRRKPLGREAGGHADDDDGW